MLWKIASGMADYRDVLREMGGNGVLRSVLVGMAVTLRNMMVELLLGIHWGEYGRYCRSQGEARIPEAAPRSRAWNRAWRLAGFRTIHGVDDEILQELANYGRPDARFVKLRFIHLRHVLGVPNRVGSVIRYMIPLAQLGAELQLTRKVGRQALLYRADERLVDHGKLIFDIASTKDCNRRLAVYAAFDYKVGANAVSRARWKLFRSLFPEFVHDIVWNHALCTIKEEVEMKHTNAR